MKHYIKNAKQCFTDDNVKIFNFKRWTDGTIRIAAGTRNHQPDIINVNMFYISDNYFNKLVKDYKPYLIGANFY